MNPDSSAAATTTPTGELASSKATWQPLRLSHLKPTLTNEEVQLASRQDLCHKFIIFGVGDMDKIDILDAILLFFGQQIIIPVLYRNEHPNKATFIAACPVTALWRLINQGLRLRVGNKELPMDIVLGFLSTNELDLCPQKCITQAVLGRWDGAKRILNLTNFHNDKALNSIYCPLSSTATFSSIMRFCKKMLGRGRDEKLSIRELNLSKNGLIGMGNAEKLFNYHLTKLDLSHNKIHDIMSLRYFSEFKITELWLDGNPLCAQYTTPDDYIKSVKSIFLHVQRLDGVMIGVERKFIPVMQNNFIGDASRVNLVKQFITHYFTFYDQNDRIVLNGIYDHDALFSTTLGTLLNPNHRQMTKAFASNRNLLKFVDYAKCHEFVLRGPEKIIAAIRRQPPTYHDYKKFNIDIMHYGDVYVVIAIQGFFCYKEFPTNPLFFNRTFVLVQSGDNEYCIINDQYHIQSRTPGMKGGENCAKPLENWNAPKLEPKIFSPSERNQLVHFLHDRTTMNDNYCRRYLEEADWNIRAALSKFVKLYKVNDVPPEAFDESSPTR